MNKLLTIHDISKITNIPESTVRFYRDKFPNYFHGKGDGKRKKYDYCCVDVTKTISRLMAKNTASCEIEGVLKDKFDEVIDTIAEPIIENATQQQDSFLIESNIINAIKVGILQQQERDKLLLDKIDMLTAKINMLESKKWYDGLKFWQK